MHHTIERPLLILDQGHEPERMLAPATDIIDPCCRNVMVVVGVVSLIGIGIGTYYAFTE